VEEASVDMAGVTVLGHNEAQEVNRQAFNVTAIDARPLYNTTLNLADALDRVAGVRVRESGGVGSNFNLSINGFAGSQVRYFVDGIPLEGFGSSFQINNIPINTAERVEVYKGVVPIWLGADALGGAVNIVTGNRQRNYVDASYSYGSFNTHRTTLNAAVTSKSGLTAQISAFQNYSDNSYRVQVEASDPYTGVYLPSASLRRFHDTYHNETLLANFGVVGKPYADKLLLGVSLGRNYQEIQTGARLVSVFGRWHRRGTLLMPTLKYAKENFLTKGLNVVLNANYNFGSEQNIDTAYVRYDWFGNFRRVGPRGGERSYTLAKFRNNNGVATATANYHFGERHGLALNNVFNTFDRTASDAVNPAAVYAPQQLQKNVLGLGYTYTIGELLSASVFAKYLTQRTVSSARNTAGSTLTRLSYGLAGTYFVTPGLQLKASYELANRLPDATELFGDLINQAGNTSLQPEQSHNLNLGATYNLDLDSDHHLQVGTSAVYRYASNFIYTRFNANQTQLILDNRDGVWTLGADADARYWYKKRFSAGASATYQYLRNTQRYERNEQGVPFTSISPAYLAQMPNIPFFFGNADASLTLPGVGGKGNNLSFRYNLLYVHRFWLSWPIFGANSTDAKFVVPRQLSHDVGVVYSLQNGRYNVGLECRNLANALLYDNFSLQKPGRAFYVNLRCFFTKTATN
jgi:outer membrane receptor protein involved in Fe transport